MLPGFDLRYHIALRWSAGVGLIALAIDMSLLWSERQNRIASDRYVRNRRGEVSKSSGLGNPTPTNSTVWWCLGFLSVQSVESDESVIQTKRTCRPSGALVCLVYAAFYKHVAPLGLNAPVILLSSGLGNPTPTHPASLAHVPIFVPPGSPVAPLGLGLLDMSPVYKHAAPLGLQKKGKRENGADSRLLYTLRSAGAKAGGFSVYRTSTQSYAHVACL